jgi:hypothetical protein
MWETQVKVARQFSSSHMNSSQESPLYVTSQMDQQAASQLKRTLLGILCIVLRIMLQPIKTYVHLLVQELFLIDIKAIIC